MILSCCYVIYLQPKIKQGILVVAGGVTLFSIQNLANGNEKFYKKIAMPAMQLFDAETAHWIAVKAAKYRLVPWSKYKESDVLVSIAV